MKMVTVKVAKLTAGHLLDYLTAIAGEFVIPPPHTEAVQKVWATGLAHKPSTRPEHCFPLIEKFDLRLQRIGSVKRNWMVWSSDGFYTGTDLDLKVAVCKALIHAKMGREITYDADIFEGPTNE